MGILEASMIRRIVRPFFASVRKIGTLVIADNANSTSPNGTLSAISAAQHLKLPVTVLICGGEKIANERAQICSRAPGVSRVLVAKGQAYENCFPEEIDQLAASLVRENNYRYIVLNHSSYGRELSPRIAALLGINQASDAMELSEVNCVRGTFAGNALTRVNIKGAKLVITIRQSSFNPVTGSGSAPIEPLHAAEAISSKSAKYRIRAAF